MLLFVIIFRSFIAISYVESKDITSISHDCDEMMIAEIV